MYQCFHINIHIAHSHTLLVHGLVCLGLYHYNNVYHSYNALVLFIPGKVLPRNDLCMPALDS